MYIHCTQAFEKCGNQAKANQLVDRLTISSAPPSPCPLAPCPLMGGVVGWNEEARGHQRPPTHDDNIYRRRDGRGGRQS